MNEDEWDEFSTAHQFRQSNEKLAHWMVPKSLEGWLGAAVGGAALVGLQWLGWNFWLALAAMFVAQFIFAFAWSFVARCRREGVPWR